MALRGYSLIQADCDTQMSSKNKREGMYVLISRTSGASGGPVESLLGSLVLESHAFFLCKPFCSLREFASIISAVYIHPQAKANGMPCQLSGQIIKMKTKHPGSAVFIQGKRRNEFPPNTVENTEYRGATFYSTITGSIPSFSNALHGCLRPRWLRDTNAGGRQTYRNFSSKVDPSQKVL